LAQTYSTTTCSFSVPRQIDGGGNLVAPFDHTGRWQLTNEQCVTVADASAGGATDLSGLENILGVGVLFMIWIIVCYGAIKLFKIFS